MGFIARSAAENRHDTTAFITKAAGSAQQGGCDVATRERMDITMLGDILGISGNEMARMRHAPVPGVYKLMKCDFHGAQIPAFDLTTHRRRVAPAALRRIPYHRVLWTHGLIPFCTETGDRLISVCPSCGRNLGWYHAAGIDFCGSCGFDLKSVESCRISDADRASTASMTSLVDPDEARHGPTLARLPADIRDIGRGAAFELGWTVAYAIIAPGAFQARNRHRALPEKEKIRLLQMGGAILEGWPDSVTSTVDRWAAQEGFMSDPLVDRLRSIGSSNSWPVTRHLLKQRFPDLFKPTQRLARKLNADKLAGGIAAAYVGISASALRDIHAQGLVRSVVSTGTRRSFATFLASDLHDLRELNGDRTTVGVAAQMLGITHFGVEQLACIGLLEALDDPALAFIYPGFRIGRRSLDELVSKLSTGATGLPNGCDEVDLRIGLAAAGGREKAWGHVIRDLCTGAIPYRIRLGKVPLARRIVIARASVATLRSEYAAGFDRSAYARPFSTHLNSRDVEDLLNIDSKAIVDATPVEFRNHLLKSRNLSGSERMNRILFVTGRMSQIAAERISFREISQRWLGGIEYLPKEMKAGGELIRLGVTGWSRVDVERAFG